VASLVPEAVEGDARAVKVGRHGEVRRQLFEAVGADEGGPRVSERVALESAVGNNGTKSHAKWLAGSPVSQNARSRPDDELAISLQHAVMHVMQAATRP
jgi:hypothetical protein